MVNGTGEAAHGTLAAGPRLSADSEAGGPCRDSATDMTQRASTVPGGPEGGRASRDHDLGHDSDAAKEQLSSGPRFLAQAEALPISNDPMGCATERRLRQGE